MKYKEKGVHDPKKGDHETGTMADVMKMVEEKRVVPVVKLDRVEDAAPLAEALIKGNLPIAEVTFRTDAAEESIRIMSEKFPEMLVGAGTVTNVAQAEKAVAAGAKFIVTPGFSRAVTEYAVKNNIPIFPGICTPTELMFALEFDLPVVKFFPAEQYGGLKTIGALAAPFPKMKFMPTGGVGPKNLKEYLANPKIVACGGSWMVKDSLVKEGKFDEIARLSAEAVALAQEV